MSISSTRSSVARVQKAIADLRIKDAAETKKESDLFIKINRATEAASRSKSASVIQSKLREIERHQKASVACSKKRAVYAKQIASKSNELNRHMVALEQAEKGERTKQEKQMKKSQDDLKRRQRQLDRSLDRRIKITAKKLPEKIEVDNVQYDVFISHASEDKESFVKDLALALIDAGINVWYDELSLEWGSGLRQQIDKGLANSRFGVVIFSEYFFAKDWPQAELDGLVSLEMSGKSRILPIWHKVTKDEVTKYSPTLAGRLALNTSNHSIAEIVEKLKALCDKP